MKESKKQLQRIEKLLRNGKNGYQEEFKELFYVDLTNLLNEYFVSFCEPQVSIEKTSRGSSVKIEFTAGGIKAFSFLPREEENVD